MHCTLCLISWSAPIKLMRTFRTFWQLRDGRSIPEFNWLNDWYLAMSDVLIDQRMNGRLTVWWNAKSTDWRIRQLTDGQTAWLTYWRPNWPTDWLADHLQTYWLIEWLADWLLTDWLTSWVTSWLIDWLTEWLTDSLTSVCTSTRSIRQANRQRAELKTGLLTSKLPTAKQVYHLLFAVHIPILLRW